MTTLARVIACLLLLSLPARAQVPTEIKIGHLHASAGPYASFSMPVYYGLKLWVDQTNASGGAFVKAYNRKLPLRLISYDDQSVTVTATTLANQLITQDKVDVLVSDAGSVLTSVIAPIAREHKMLLFNPNGSGATLFSKDNPYIVLTSAPSSSIWPRNLAEYLAMTPYRRIAIIYCTNEFTGPHAEALKHYITAKVPNSDIVLFEGVPTSTSNYTVLLSRIAAVNPQAVIELGYPNNDIAFLRNVQDAGQTYPFLFAIYPGLETDLMLRTVGADGIRNVFTYVTPVSLVYKPNTGMTTPQLLAAWDAAYRKGGSPAFGWNAEQGYTAGLAIGQALATADSLDQLALRKALFLASNKMVTLDGPFILTEDGSQAGEIPAIGQLHPDAKGKLRLHVLYPPEAAKAQLNTDDQ